MLYLYTTRLTNRLEQLIAEIQRACDTGLDYYDRIREFKRFCDETPVISNVLANLPHATYDFTVDWREMPDMWREGREGYGMRWNAITQMIAGGSRKVDEAWFQLSTTRQDEGLQKITEIFFIPIYHYLIDQLGVSSTMMYVLLRYKRWVEWFIADHLRGAYGSAGRDGEAVLDGNLRRFLFENGVDYPFSQPASPRGKADIVAGLETDDPLVLEVKIWDTEKGYREDRLRDGLRQVIDYATKYGKDKGYIVVFNLDRQPLSFAAEQHQGEWPPRIEHGGRTYYFIDVHIADVTKSISQQDKGKRVELIEVKLKELLAAV
jgi:hypothetical protein